MPFILNVDDYAPGRYTRTKILTQAGFEVREAATGGEALRIAKEKPQLILLDVNLPDIGGYEVCRRVKQDPETAGTIVLHLSASSLLPEHRIAGLNGGADSYLTEPIAPEVLVATIRALIRAHSAEEALRYSNRQLRDFANMITHELKQPLRSVAIYSDLLSQKVEGRLSVGEQEYLAQIRTAARLMGQRIDSILEYSKAEQGSGDTRDLSSEEVLDECLDELQMLIAETCTQVDHHDLPHVHVNRTGLTRVFVNLITNAIKYKGPADPIITIRAKPQGESYLFSVRDNGLGIEPRFHNQIFEPFERLHGAELSGAGLGLALCRRVVTSAGGEMWVESNLGEGSTFFFTLPAAKSRAAHSV